MNRWFMMRLGSLISRLISSKQRFKKHKVFARKSKICLRKPVILYRSWGQWTLLCNYKFKCQAKMERTSWMQRLTIISSWRRRCKIRSQSWRWLLMKRRKKNKISIRKSNHRKLLSRNGKRIVRRFIRSWRGTKFCRRRRDMKCSCKLSNWNIK